ncbi:MAG: hypothetical protein ACRDSN_19980 [Pseudonocardiaceae bacterium]
MTAHPATAATGSVASALHDAAALTGRIEVVFGNPTEPDWLPYRDLVRSERLPELLDAATTLCGGCPTRAAHTAAATLMAGDLATAFATPIAAALVAQHRALLLDPNDVHVRIGPDGVHGLAVTAAHLALLPDDPLTGHHQTTVVDDPTALRTAAATSYATLLTPLLEQVRAAVQRGHRALWADAAERLASAILLALRALDRPDHAPAEVALLLAAAPPRLHKQIDWITVHHGDRQLPWKRRTVCCLAYHTPRWTGQYCATCPLTPPADTIRRISAWLHNHDST